jgi:hypothetical protein
MEFNSAFKGLIINVSHKVFQELVQLPSPGNQEIPNVMGLLDSQSFMLSLETLQTRLTLCLVYTYLLVAVDEIQCFQYTLVKQILPGLQ